MATNLKEIATVLETENIKKWILPTITKLLTDESDLVKINVIESSAAIIYFIEKEQVQELFALIIKSTDVSNKTWRLRYALAKTLADFCPFLGNLNETYKF